MKIKILLCFCTILWFVIISCSFKKLNEKYTPFLLNFPELNHPIDIDSTIYTNLSRNQYQAIDTMYYSFLYNRDTIEHPVYYALGKFYMGADYEGLLYAKVKKEIVDTTIHIYLLVGGYDSVVYKILLSTFYRNADTMHIQRLIVNNDEFRIKSAHYLHGVLAAPNTNFTYKLRQQKKDKQFRVDTLH